VSNEEGQRVSGIDEVLNRFTADPEFRRELRRDPHAALAAYDLTTSELRELADRISRDAPHGSPVERRTGRAAVFELFARRTRDPDGGSTEIQ
jgi:hypothetical protein